MSLKSFFANTVETRELHPDPSLRTNYYRNNYTQVTEALKILAKVDKLEVRDINSVHREIYMLGNGYDVIVTLYEITPAEIGVDFKVNWFGGFGYNRPKKKVLLYYAKLKEVLRFKGVSLHP